MGFLGAAHEWGWRVGGSKRLTITKICHTYHTMIKLGMIPYSKKLQKIYESDDIPLEFS